MRGFSSVLSVVLVSMLLPIGCAPVSAPGEVKEQLLFSSLNAAMLSVSGTSAEDVYAVGADPGDCNGPYVLHYDGTAWKRLLTGAQGTLWWISVTPIGEAFYMGGEGGLVLRCARANGEFVVMDTPAEPGDTVFGVWGTDEQHVWAVGGDLSRPDDGGFLWRYDGSEWREQTLPEEIGQDPPVLFKVWGRSADSVYVVGRLGMVLSFDGTAWSQVSTETTRTLFTVHGNAADVAAVGGFNDAVILEMQGGTFVDQAPDGTPQMNGVYVPDKGDAVAVGNYASVARRIDGVWTLQPYSLPTVRDLHGTWVDPDGGIWAVGGNLSSDLTDGIIAYVGSATVSTAVAE